MKVTIDIVMLWRCDWSHGRETDSYQATLTVYIYEPIFSAFSSVHYRNKTLQIIQDMLCNDALVVELWVILLVSRLLYHG